MKGRSGFDINAPVASPSYMPLGPRRKAVALRTVMVDVFKAELYRLLALVRPTDEEIADAGYPPGYVHVPDTVDAEWCKQLTAERRVRTKSGHFKWDKHNHPRNEALDCRIYTRAALWVMGVAGWKPERWMAMRERRGLEGEAKQQSSALMPRTAREASEYRRNGTVNGVRVAPEVKDGAEPPRGPCTAREASEFRRFGTVNGVPFKPHSKPATLPQPEATPTSWANLLRRK